MKLLAFETATEACSVALWIDGEVRERFEVAPRRHAELSLPWAEALLAEAGIDRAALDVLAVSRGPGAFTGVRLGISLVQGIALALDRPVAALSTLAVLAAGGSGPEPNVVASIDARMGEVYAGAFEVRDGEPIPLGPETVGAAEDVELPRAEGDWRATGTGSPAGSRGWMPARCHGRRTWRAWPRSPPHVVGCWHRNRWNRPTSATRSP